MSAAALKTLSAQEMWANAQRRLRTQLGSLNYNEWFGRVELVSADSKCLRLSVVTQFLKHWLETKYAEDIVAAWRAESKINAKLIITVRTFGTPAKQTVLPPRRSNGWRPSEGTRPMLAVRMNIPEAAKSASAPKKKPAAVTIEEIKRVVAAYYNLSEERLCSKLSLEAIVPRQVAMYLCRYLTISSLSEISTLFERDRKAVLQSVEKVEHLCKTDPQVLKAVKALRASLAR